MAEHEVRVDRGAVSTVTMSNPPRHTMTAAMVTGLDAAVASLEDDEAVRVVVLTGGGDGVFIAHYEVNELASSAERQRARAESTGAPDATPTGDARARLHPLNRVMRRLESMPKITIAAMNGNAAGGGFELALACDFRLLADGPFRVGLPETGVGIIPGAGGTQRLTHLLGVARALDLILHGTRMTPAEAHALGLVSRLLPIESFHDDVAAFAATLARRAPIALAAAKESIRCGVELPIDDGLLLEQQLFNRCMRSEDAAGAMRAALEGRGYDFHGR